MSNCVKKTILIVEDEILIAMLEMRQLESENYKVLHASTGEKAVDLICSRIEKVDLILMDIDLGKGMDGTEAAKQILRCEEIPILFLSSHTEKEIVEKTEVITNYGYVVKNSSFTVLDASIKMAFKLFEAFKRINEERMKNEASYEEMQVINESLLATQEELTETEKSLRHSEENYRYIDDASLDSIYSYDRQGRFTHANRALCKLLGLPKNEIVGKTHEQLGFPKKQCKEWSELHQRVYETNSTIIAVTETPIPGSPSIYFEVVLNPIHDDHDYIIGISGTTRDITERVIANERILESERKYRVLHESAGIGIGYYSLDGVVLSYNKLAAGHMGGVPEDFNDKSIYDLFPGKAAQLYHERIKAASLTNAPICYEDEVPLPDGNKHFLSTFTQVTDQDGSVFGIQIISQDITEQKKIEANLLSQKKYFELIIEHTMAGYWDWNIETGEEYFSHAFKKMLGYEANEIENRADAWRRLVFAEDLAAITEAYNKHVESKAEKPYYNEVRFHHKKGATVWVICTGKVIEWDANGKAKRMVGCHIDITQRKRAEAELKESEERFRALHNASFGGIAIHDKGIILECNHGLSIITGYPEDELTSGMDGLLLFAEQSRSDVKSKMLSGYEKPYEAIGLRKNGEEYPMRLEARNIHYKGRLVRVIEVKDITEEKAKEKESKESKERFSTYVNFAPDGIFIADENGQYLEVNPAACEMTGYSQKELLGMNIRDVMQEKEHKKGLEHFLRTKQEGSARGDIGFVTKSGENRFWHVAAVKLTDSRYLGFTKDITDQISIEQALREKEEKYRFALEGSNLGEWDWDYVTGKVIRNARWAEMLDYSPDELEMTIQQGIDLMHYDDREMVNRAIKDHLEAVTDHYYIEYRLRSKSGEYKWIRDCGKIVVRDEKGNPLRLCGTHEDIDEKKRSRDRIDSLLAEKELILKEVHHRIKNNMNTIISLLELQEGSIAEASAKTALRDSASKVGSMSLLYDKLYLSCDHNELSVQDYIPDLVTDVVSNFPNSRSIKVKMDVDHLFLKASQLQPIGIIVNELITNVMKYAFGDRREGIVTVSAKNNEGCAQITVQDDGIGLPESIDFDNTSGFGLKLISALAQQLNGTVNIERGNGTKFVLQFRHSCPVGYPEYPVLT